MLKYIILFIIPFYLFSFESNSEIEFEKKLSLINSQNIIDEYKLYSFANLFLEETPFQDPETSLIFFKKSCSSGFIPSCQRIVIDRYNPYNTIKSIEVCQGDLNCESFLVSCLELGNTASCGILGVYLSKYKKIKKDLKKAIELTSYSCLEGNNLGCLTLGSLYLEESEFKDEFKAFSLFHDLCENGFAKGCYNLSYLYSNGILVSENYSKAYKYAQLSCRYGEEKACTFLEKDKKQTTDIF